MLKSAKKLLRSTKGETILESVASLLIFVVLMVAVTSMVASSLKMTTHASTKYITLRENVAKTNDLVTSGDMSAINFKFKDEPSWTTDQKILKTPTPDGIAQEKGMNIIAFYPDPEGDNENYT